LPGRRWNVIQFHIMHRPRLSPLSPGPLSLAAGTPERLALAAVLAVALWAAVAWAMA
jgi:hypothetical protein